MIALVGDVCHTAGGPYNPTTSSIGLPVTYNGFGFYAQGGGTIDTADPVTITTTDPLGTGGSHAVWADGAVSQISLSAGSTLLPGGDNSFGAYASNGGRILAGDQLSIGTSGAGAIAVNSEGSGSSITLGSTTITTSGQGAIGLYANDSMATGSGGTITVNGPIQITTQSTFGYNVFASGAGANIALNGSATLNVGSGSFGLYATGGGVITTASSLSITAANSGFGGGVEADNGSSITLGGATTIKLTSTNLVGLFTTGTGSVTVNDALLIDAGSNSAIVAQGGSIALNGAGTIQSSGANAVVASAGGLVTLGQASLQTSVSDTSDGGRGLYATGSGSQIGATNVVLSTTGALSNAAVADNGGFVSLVGGNVTTSGNGSWGLNANGVGSQLSASGVTVMTTGGADASGNVALGAFAQNGATLSLNNSSFTTTGAGAHGIEVGGASTVTFVGGSVTTSGPDAFGLFSTDAKSSIKASGAFTVSTSGALSDGVLVLSDARATLSQGVVYTTGAGAPGLAVGGAGSTLSATNVTITTTGAFDASTGFQSQGVLALNGGLATLVGDTISTSGAQGHGVLAAESGEVVITGSSITVGGTDADGLLASGQGSKIVASGLNLVSRSVPASFSVQGARADQGGGLDLSSTTISTSGANVAGVGVDTAGTARLTGVAITTSGNNAFGLVAVNLGQTNMIGGSIQTTGATADGVNGSSGGSILLSAVTIATAGDGAKGISINGASTTLTGDGLTIATAGGRDATTGYAAQGVFNGDGLATQNAGNSVGGTVTLTDSTVTTSGANANGVQTANSGITKFYGGSIATSGDGAVALLSQSGASVTVAPDTASKATQISTSGLSATAVVANTGGGINLAGASVATTGDGATALAVTDAGSSLTATNVTVSTKGGQDANTGFYAVGVYNGASPTGTVGGTLTLVNASVTTTGLNATALQTQNGGGSTVTGGAFTTSGSNAAAVSLTGTGSIGIGGATLTTTGDGSVGLVINGSGGTITANNLTISTSGGVWTAGNGSHADGIYNGAFGSTTSGGTMTVTDTTVKTSGYQAYGLSAGSGGTTTFYGGSILTTGAQATAVTASNGGSLTIQPDLAGVRTTVSTTGAGAYALVADGGAHLSVTGALVTTTANGSGGIGVNGTGSEIDATNVSISTAGALDAASGLHAYGAYNGPNSSFTTGGVLNLTSVTISTQGAGMYGVYSNTGGVTSFAGGAVTTAGAGAHGLYAGGGGSLDAEAVRVTTSGQGAYGAYVSGAGVLTLGQNASLTTSGANANALDVSGAGSTATLNGGGSPRGDLGGVTLTATGANAAGLWVDSGGAATIHALALNSAGDGISINGASTVSAPGAVYLTTTTNAGAALKLSGDGATFNGAGGGTISAAGQAIALLNGANQTASFTGYTIQSAGDLVYADPSTSTVNFTRTTANAGTGNLLNATNQSDITLNALAANLIGAIATDATSTSNVNLSGGTTWTVAGNSTVTNLNVNGSSVVFAPSANGAFKTLTVNNYTGANASMTFNASIAGPTLGADQLVINGGKATGKTLVSIHAVPDPPSTATPTSGTPLITTINGGSIAPGAFTLAGPVAANGFYYTLQEQNGSDVLIANQGPTQSQVNSSLSTLAQAKQAQTVTSRVLGSILTGATEQINCSSCSSGFASFGSFALGAHGRWTLSPSLAILAGGSYDSYSDRGVRVNNSYQLALAARYDMVQLGHYRPFFEAGVAVTPYANITFSRAIVSSLAPATATGNAQSHAETVYGRIGYIWRVSPRDEVAAYSDLSRSWDFTSGYTETTTGLNPFGATVGASLDTLNVWRIGAQYTHLFGEHVEANVDAGFAQAFDARFGTSAAVSGFGAASGVAPTDFHWFELGGRLSYRFARNLTGDAFVLGTLGAQPAGSQVHGGLALRLAF